MATVHPNQFAAQLIDILGLKDLKHITSINIHVQFDDVVRVTVEHLLMEEQAEKLITEARDYKLVPIGDVQRIEEAEQ